MELFKYYILLLLQDNFENINKILFKKVSYVFLFSVKKSKGWIFIS